jgi:hypothetical protein
LSSVYYSIGYTKVKLYEIQEAASFKPLSRFDKKSFLRSALRSFQKIGTGQPDFYKAQTAIKKIEKQFSRDAKAGRRTAPVLIFLLSFLICLTMQFFFWLGRPSRKDAFVVNNSSLMAFLSQHKLDNFANNAKQLALLEFNNVKDLQASLQHTLPLPDSLSNKLGTEIIERKSRLDFQPIDSAPYALITFGSLIFMVIGLFLRDISKLKVGSIELEKTTSDTISTSPNLGISPSPNLGISSADRFTKAGNT